MSDADAQGELNMRYRHLFSSTAIMAFAITAGCGSAPTTVAPSPTTAVYLAFGDSLVETKFSDGSISDDPWPARCGRIVGRPVYNAGRGGELAAESLDRFRAALQPPITGVLILHGANDVNTGGVTAALAAIQEMITTARARGLSVYVGTLPPFTAGGSRVFSAALVPSFNDGVRHLSGATVIDLDTTWRADLMGPDGLHPTDAGYDVIAARFAAGLQRKNLDRKE